MPEVTPNDPPPPPRRSAFEWSLSALRPADADVARPSFMYKAGQASREKAVRFWRAVATLSALVTVGTLGVAVLYLMAGAVPVRTEPQLPPRSLPSAAVAVPTESETLIVVRPPTSIPATSPTAPADPTPTEIATALARRRDVLVGGLGLIPDAKPPAPSPEGPLFSSPGMFAVPTSPKPTDPR